MKIASVGPKVGVAVPPLGKSWGGTCPLCPPVSRASGLQDNSKNTFVGAVRSLGQHEFAFGFCGCTRSLAVEIRALLALVF